MSVPSIGVSIPASRLSTGSSKEAVEAKGSREMVKAAPPAPPMPVREDLGYTVEKIPADKRIGLGLLGLGLVVLSVASNKVLNQDQQIPVNDKYSTLPSILISGGFGLVGSLVGINAMEGLHSKNQYTGNDKLKLKGYLNSTRPATWLERAGYVSLGAALIAAGVAVDRKYPSNGALTLGSLIPATLEIAGGTVLFDVAIGGFRVLKK